MKAILGAKAALAAATAAYLTMTAALADDTARATGIPVDENAGYLKPGELPSLVLLPPPPTLSSPRLQARFLARWARPSTPRTPQRSIACSFA